MDFKKSSIFLGLVASSTLAFSAPAEAAALSFGPEGIVFDVDTLVNFTFVQSQGFFQSDFGVFNVVTGASTVLFSENPPGFDHSDGDFLGTCGFTVTTCTASFEFEAGTEYSFFLTTQGNPSVVFSTTQAQFTGDVENEGATIAFDDTGADNDEDFNDFVVTAQAAPVPEPTTLAGLGLAAASLAFLRRRQSKPVA